MAGRPVGSLVPVATVFGPFLRDPVEMVTRELRAVMETMTDYCAVHEVREHGPAYRVCFECGHLFPTAEALLADHAAVVERLNAELPPPPWDPAWHAPAVAETDPERVYACPHCAHDF